ncbi:MAG TPA: DUF6036 family nucleotidyltransferase [Actinomycetota bacterium]|nr:DUF6036 family nucleotidyltransferase [Actinomycetota bacterium]
MTHQVSPEHILETLTRHRVDYVVIGSVAAILQGVGLPRTLDIDVAASHARTNLRKLSAALKEMDARLRLGSTPDAEALAAPIDDRMLAGVFVVTSMTRFGPFDVLFEPPGMPPFEDLKRRAPRLERFGLEVPVAALEDIVASKRAAGREKDAAHLTILLEHLKDQ